QAHVAVRRHRSGPRLTAYVVTTAPVQELRRMLTARLPRYFVPHHIVAVDEIPLNTNGKVDDAALAATDAAREAGQSDEFAGPATDTEAVIAEALAEVLDIGDVARVDVTADFLDLGLDSIVALSVVQAVRRRGVTLRARLMLDCGTVRDLGAAIDSDTEVHGAESDGDDTPIPLLPSGHWLFQYGDPRRLAQTEALRLPDGITGEQIGTMLRTVIDGHEVLRSRLDLDAMTLVAHPGALTVDEVVVSGEWTAAVAEHTRLAVERIDPQRGSMLDVVWLRDPDGGAGVLLLTAHVLALDPASWRIVLGELETGWHAVTSGRRPALGREHTSLRQWSLLLAERALKLDTCDFWERQLDGGDPDIGARRIRPESDRVGDVVVRMAFTEPDVTARVLAGPIPVTEVLAAATARTMNSWRRHRGQETPSPLLALETHGRADDLCDTDTGDTVGLLSAIYPLRLSADDVGGVADLFAAIPGDGIDYALLRYLRADTAERLAAHRDPQVLLNYLGRIHLAGGGDALRPDR
ncbi:MAG TPA: phosphopantetheine-binding protein, partial [Mycobacterium sp.]